MDVDVKKLGDLLLNNWAIPRPNLLISIFGGHSKFDSKKIGEFPLIKIQTGKYKIQMLCCAFTSIKKG